MRSMYTKESEKTFILILSGIFILLTFLIIRDIFQVLIYSLLISYFLFPLYNFYLGKVKDQRISAILTLITGTFLIFVPLVLLFYFLVLELIKIIIQYRIYIENPEILNAVIVDFLESFTDSTVLSSINYADFFSIFVLFVLDISKSFFQSLPLLLIYFFIMLFISYYTLVHNKSILNAVNEYIPLSLSKQNEILRNITKNIRVLFRGYFLTGIIQTAVAVVGYIVFGAPNILIISFLTLIVSLVPYLGTPLVWLPVAVYMILTGNQFNGVGLLLFGTLVISMVDNFVRPVLMSHKETLSPPLVFIGFVGGMFAFGISGIILGPIIIAITAILLRYLREYYEIKS